MAGRIWRNTIAAAALIVGVEGATAPKAPAAPPAPTAPVAADPSATTAAFGDWVLRCVRAGEAAATAQRFCEVIQSIQVEGRQGPIAQLAIGRVQAKDPLKVTLVVPNNVSFATRPKLGVGDKDDKAIDLGWQRCLPGGCFADAVAREETLTAWRAATAAGQIQFPDGAGRVVAVPFSFRGLAQALDALAKT